MCRLYLIANCVHSNFNLKLSDRILCLRPGNENLGMMSPQTQFLNSGLFCNFMRVVFKMCFLLLLTV